MKETKIFISHRSLDVNYAAAVVDFLEDLGVSSKSIVCTSVPDHLIPNGQKIYDWLRSQFTEFNLHMLILLSDNYYQSPDCLNEMGAAWVTKTDSDVILLPGFGPERLKGCIGTDTMAIQCDAKDDILEDRIRQLRDKVCKEFNLPVPNERRWGNIKSKTIKQLREKESETEGDQRQKQAIQPVFDLKITALNKQVPGTAEVMNLWDSESLPVHKNVQYKLELCNDADIRSLKVFGRMIETGVVKKNKNYTFNVCYMESSDSRWLKHVFTLTRDKYSAGVDGIPKFVFIEYFAEVQKYQQKFYLDEDQVYLPTEPEIVQQRDIEKTIQMKNRMQRDFLKPASELKQYSREDLWKHPEKRFISDEVIIVSTECQDVKWNTDGGFGKYEIYNFCDEGLLFWDNTGFSAEIEYYHNDELLTAFTNRMLCLPYEKVVAYDLKGNSRYNMPIIHADYRIGSLPFKYYYRDRKSGTIIDNAVIAEVKQ